MSSAMTKKILIIQTAFIGDVVLTLPLVDALREGFPEAEIGFVATPGAAGLLEQDNRIDEVIIYDKKGKDAGIGPFLRLSRYIKSRHFDIAFIAHLSLRSTLLAYTAGIKQRVGFDAALGSTLLTTKAHYDEDIHLVERILKLAYSLGIEEKKISPKIFIPADDVEAIKEFLRSEGISKDGLLIGINPGSTWPTKRWLKERYASLADSLIDQCKAEIVILGGEEDIELAERIKALMKNKPIIASGKTTLTQLAALIKECKLLVTNDTGPMHIAGAINTPVVVIYGPTSPEVGVGGPYGGNFVAVQREDIHCRPCGTHGSMKCKEATFACMEEISSDEVFAVVKEFLSVDNGVRPH